LWKGAPEIFFGELEKVGILGYEYSKREFEVVKDAEKLNVKKRELIKIEKV